MAYPTIQTNAGSGSDTLASGAGPGSALTGTNATWSAAVVTLDGSPDLSGVATDGSAAIWIDTTTGRKFYKITAVDDGLDQVTVATTPSGTSGRSWAIGGKRATLTNLSTIISDPTSHAGWTIALEDDQTISTSLSVGAQTNTREQLCLCSSVEGTRRIITMSANSAHFSSGASSTFPQILFKDLTFKNSNGTKTSANWFSYSHNVNIVAVNCIFGDTANSNNINSTTSRVTGSGTFTFHGCGFVYHQSDVIPAGWSTYTFVGCQFLNNTGRVILSLSNSTGHKFTFRRCLFQDNGDTVIEVANAQNDFIAIDHCTFYSNDDTPVKWTAGGGFQELQITNCIFANNTGYGLEFASTLPANVVIDWNNYYSNSSGARNNAPTGPNDIAVDPGFGTGMQVGTSMKAAAGLPDAGQSVGGVGVTVDYRDLGGAQRQEPAGGTVAFPRSRNTLLRM